MQNFSSALTGQIVTAQANQNAPGNAVQIDTPANIGKRITQDVCIYNPGPLTVYARTGTSNQITAHNTTPVCWPIAPGYASFAKGDDTHLALWSPGANQDCAVFIGRGN